MVKSKTFAIFLAIIIISVVSIPAAAESGFCRTQGYWKNHPEVWSDASLDLGGVLYDQEALLAILNTPTRGDASLILAHQLIAAKLNIWAGAMGDTTIFATLTDADTWLAANADADGLLPYKVSGSAKQAAVAASTILDEFNNGLNAAICEAGGPPPVWE